MNSGLVTPWKAKAKMTAAAAVIFGLAFQGVTNPEFIYFQF